MESHQDPFQISFLNHIMDFQDMLAGLGIDCLSGMQQDAVQTLGHHDNGVLLAPTGSGKTVAFLLPLTARLDSGDDLPQALVLSTTRELSQQTFGVWQAMKKKCASTSKRS